MSTLRTRVSALAACALVASPGLPFAPARGGGRAGPEVPWCGVEAVEGPSTEPRIVPLSANPADLAPGTYYSAVRIDLTPLEGSRTLALPVALEVPEPPHGGLPP